MRRGQALLVSSRADGILVSFPLDQGLGCRLL